MQNESYDIAITAQGTQGEGIGKVDGFTVFVKDAVACDVLNVKVIKVNKSYAFARINQVLTPSPRTGLFQHAEPLHAAAGAISCTLLTISN